MTSPKTNGKSLEAEIEQLKKKIIAFMGSGGDDQDLQVFMIDEGHTTVIPNEVIPNDRFAEDLALKLTTLLTSNKRQVLEDLMGASKLQPYYITLLGGQKVKAVPITILEAELERLGDG